MKIKLTTIVLAAIGVTIFVASCKKDGVKSNTSQTSATAASNQVLAIRVATNFYKAITGVYGGSNLNSGLKINSVNPAAKRGPVLMDVNPLCGMVVDTSSNFSTTIDTTTFRYGGTFSFTYTCSSTSVNGYTTNNSLYHSTTTTNTRDSVQITQNYTVVALDSTYKTVSLNGTQNVDEQYAIFNGPYYELGTTGFKINTDFWAGNGAYTITNVTVDVSTGVPDMTSGSALLTYYYTYQNQNQQNQDDFTTTYATITFLGNYLARVDIGIPILPPTSSYVVNVLTGKIVTN